MNLKQRHGFAYDYNSLVMVIYIYGGTRWVDWSNICSFAFLAGWQKEHGQSEYREKKLTNEMKI